MSIRQPFKTFVIILVGKSHCLEAVNTFKNMSICLAKSLSQQCRLHTSEKLKDIFQSYSFYTRIWGEDMTFQMLSAIRKSAFVSGQMFLMSALCLSPSNWKDHKIPDDALESCVTEYETVGELCKSTVHCENCNKRQLIDKKVSNIEYCMCKGSIGYADKSRTYDSWEPFLERMNIIVWRRKHHKHSNLYSYKVYGTYDDMSLNSFMEVQLNPSFRTQWDTTALQLEVIDSDSASNSDLLYWLVKFPHFFANRDYVFRRRFKVNQMKKEVVIFSEVVDYSQIPVKKGIHRVNEYWSIMVLKANESFNKPGMSYTLTYFDNPGTSLPVAVTDFVASKAFPDFLTKVYEAAMSLQRRWENGEDVYVTLPPSLRYLRKTSDEPLLSLRDEIVPSGAIIKPRSYTGYSQEYSPVNSEKKCESGVNKKLSLRFKKVVIDLLEAIEVVSPEYEEKSLLTKKIENLVDKLEITNSKKHKLVRKLQALSIRTKLFMERAAEKKEESFKIMNELERKHYYDSLADEPNLLHFVGLLLAINEILKVDKDMRTGKDLSKADKNLDTQSISQQSQNQFSSTKSLNSYNNANPCECCEKKGWYTYVTSLLSNSKEQVCICSHNVILPKNSNDLKSNSEDANLEREKKYDESSSWFYVPWVFASKTENTESTENEKDELMLLQFWKWVYKLMFKANV